MGRVTRCLFGFICVTLFVLVTSGWPKRKWETVNDPCIMVSTMKHPEPREETFYPINMVEKYQQYSCLSLLSVFHRSCESWIFLHSREGMKSKNTNQNPNPMTVSIKVLPMNWGHRTTNFVEISNDCLIKQILRRKHYSKKTNG